MFASHPKILHLVCASCVLAHAIIRPLWPWLFLRSPASRWERKSGVGVVGSHQLPSQTKIQVSILQRIISLACNRVAPELCPDMINSFPCPALGSTELYASTCVNLGRQPLSSRSLLVSVNLNVRNWSHLVVSNIEEFFLILTLFWAKKTGKKKKKKKLLKEKNKKDK